MRFFRAVVMLFFFSEQWRSQMNQWKHRLNDRLVNFIDYICGCLIFFPFSIFSFLWESLFLFFYFLSFMGVLFFSCFSPVFLFFFDSVNSAPDKRWNVIARQEFPGANPALCVHSPASSPTGWSHWLHFCCCTRPSLRRKTVANESFQSISMRSIIQPENENIGRSEGVADMSDPSVILIRANQSLSEG